MKRLLVLTLPVLLAACSSNTLTGVKTYSNTSAHVGGKITYAQTPLQAAPTTPPGRIAESILARSTVSTPCTAWSTARSGSPTVRACRKPRCRHCGRPWRDGSTFCSLRTWA